MTFERTRFSLLRGLIASTLATALAVPLATSSAFAAEEQFDEIIVTALGRATTLEDSPAAVTVVTQDTIERKGIERVEDFVALVPGMSVVNTAEVADTQVNIRGLNGAGPMMRKKAVAACKDRPVRSRCPAGKPRRFLKVRRRWWVERTLRRVKSRCLL